MKEDPALVKKVKGTFLFKVTKGPGGKTGSWFVDAKKDGRVKENCSGENCEEK